MNDTIKRVIVTDEAREVINRLKSENGKLMFHLSGGCCDGSSPMCFGYGEFRTGEGDILLGHIDGCPFYISHSHFDVWKNSQITVDIVKGRGASFSLEIPLGVRFVVRSRLLSDDEGERLEPVRMNGE